MPKIDEVKQATERINAIINGVSEERRGEVYQELSNLPGCRSTKQNVTDILRSNSLAFPELPKGQITDTEEALELLIGFEDCLKAMNSLKAHESLSEKEIDKIRKEQVRFFRAAVGSLEGLQTERWQEKDEIGKRLKHQKRALRVRLMWGEHSITVGRTKDGPNGLWDLRTTGRPVKSSKSLPKIKVK